MDDVNSTNAIWNLDIQFDDIYLTESEDFWQEQELDCGFELTVSEESSSTGCTSKQTSISTTREKSLCIVKMSDELVMPIALTCFADNSVDELLKIGNNDAPASSTGMSSEQTLPSEDANEGSEAMCEIEMIDASLTGMFSSLSKICYLKSTMKEYMKLR